MNLIKGSILILFCIFATISCYKSPSATQPELEKAEAENGEVHGIEGKDYMTGEVLVKFKSSVNKPAIEKIIKTLGLKKIKVISSPNLYLLKIVGSSTVPEAIENLKKFDEVDYSEPNYIRRGSQK